MTTHQLATLFDNLRSFFAASLKADAGTTLTEASEALRELPDQPLKAIVKAIKAKPDAPAAGKAARKSAINMPDLIDRIRRVRSGDHAADTVLPDVETLTDTQLKEVLRAFDAKATKGKAGNLANVRQLLTSPAHAADQPIPHSTAADPQLVEIGVQTYKTLRDAEGVSIVDVRTRFAPVMQYPKAVLEEVCRQLEYTPSGSAREIADRLLSNLEGLKLSQIKGEMILTGR